MTKPKKRRSPNPLRKWAKEIESFEVFSCADGTFKIEPIYVDGVSRYSEDWDEIGMRGKCSLGIFERAGLEADVSSVLAKALRDAKK